MSLFQLCQISKFGGNSGRSCTLRTGKQRFPGKGIVVVGSGFRQYVVVGVVLPCGTGLVSQRHFALPVTWSDSPLLLVTPLTFLSFIRLLPSLDAAFLSKP